MDRLKKKLKKKLGSRVGESIAETMVALLIGALALTMLAGAITSSIHMIKENQAAVAKYYGAANAMATMESNESITTGNAQVSIDNKDLNSTLSKQAYQNISVTYVKNHVFKENRLLKKAPVIAYKKN